MKNDFINKIFRGDKGIWFIFMFLCMISIIEVFSATSQLSYNRPTSGDLSVRTVST